MFKKNWSLGKWEHQEEIKKKKIGKELEILMDMKTRLILDMMHLDQIIIFNKFKIYEIKNFKYFIFGKSILNFKKLSNFHFFKFLKKLKLVILNTIIKCQNFNIKITKYHCWTWILISKKKVKFIIFINILKTVCWWIIQIKDLKS